MSAVVSTPLPVLGEERGMKVRFCGCRDGAKLTKRGFFPAQERGGCVARRRRAGRVVIGGTAMEI